MPSVNIIINQVGISSGTAGVSRTDLISGFLVTLTNDPVANVGVTSWRWSLLSWPKDTATEAAPALTGALTSTATFTPYKSGTYIIQLIVNSRITGTIGAAIITSNLQFRLPADKETNEFPGGWNFGLLQALHTIDAYGGGGALVGPAGGDLSGTYPMPNVVKLRGRTISTVAPNDGYLLSWNASLSQWVPVSSAGTGPVSGDLSGTLPSPTVVKIEGYAVVATQPIDGYALTWDPSGGLVWKSDKPIPGGDAGGDLSGTYPRPTVVKIQTRSVSASAPTDGYALVWSTSNNQWEPNSVNLKPINVGTDTLAAAIEWQLVTMGEEPVV